MFFAAFTSALSWWPQARHRNTAWLSRLSGAHFGHHTTWCARWKTTLLFGRSVTATQTVYSLELFNV
jgi:hypothetical protein